MRCRPRSSARRLQRKLIVGEAANGNQCVEMLAKLKPDILLLDLRTSEKDGLSVLEEVKFLFPAESSYRSHCGGR